MNRRKFLSSLSVLLALSQARGLAQLKSLFKKRKPAAPALPLVYIGSVPADPKAQAIYVARFNPATGQLSPLSLAAETARPSFLASAKLGKRQLLYAANEGDGEADSGVSAYTIDPATGALTFLNKATGGGSGPCYVSVDATSSAVFTANYGGRSVTTYQVKPDGSLTPPVEKLDFQKAEFGHHGPNAARQDASHPHSATISPDNRFLVVNDLGNDGIVTFFIHPETAKLGPPQLNPNRVPGSGPRHVAFHPNGRWVYGIDELASRVDQYLWNTTHGLNGGEPVAMLTNAGNSVSTVDEGFHGENTGAEIAVSPDGQYILCSNRGENSLVVFRLDPVTGAPSFVQRIGCGGKTPRQFTLDATGRWVLCGNQNSATITVFTRNEATGMLSGPVQTVAVDVPQMILFA
jgi:6-phosphogluconolactonase